LTHTSAVPWWISILSDIIVLIGYGLFVRTLQENEYAGRVVTVEADQALISTGPYARVRHPMYLAALLIFMLAPLALDSLWGLIPALFVAAGFVLRILAEEKTLLRELPGYVEYCQQVRYRLLPGIW
jgi:protein-S-isoprenylcysteine O-methyltransferase Ste14